MTGFFEKLWRSRTIRYHWRRIIRARRVNIDGVVIDCSDPQIAGARDNLWRGSYEGAEREAILPNLRDDDVVLEIGAGLGLVSALCAQRIGSHRVHAYEANPEMRETIEKTYRQSGVSPYLTFALVGAKEGEKTFYVSDNFFSSSLIDRGNAREIRVPQLAFSRLCEELKPTFLILDVEGAEAEILAGADLAGVRKICVELHPHIIGDAACSQIIAGLIARGFVMKLGYSRSKTLFFERPDEGVRHAKRSGICISL